MSPRFLLYARRLLVGLIVTVALALAWNAVHTWRARLEAARELPALLGAGLRRAAEGFEYSEHRNGFRRFRIRAERLLETRAGVHLLEGIEAGDFDRREEARHSIRSRRARYDAKGGTIDFSGEVRLELGEKLHLETRSLHYDIAGETASTADRIEIASGEAMGSALGARYERARETLELRDEVRLRVEAGGELFRASSRRALVDMGRDRIEFLGGAAVESERSGAMSGEKVVLGLGPGRRVEVLAAEGAAAARLADARGTRELEGEWIEFGITGGKRLERVRVAGAAVLRSVSAAGRERLDGKEIDLDFDPVGAPREMRARGGVRLVMAASGQGETEVSGEKVVARFAPDGSPGPVEVDGAARLSFPGSAGERNTLEARHVRVDFADSRTTLQSLKAEGTARWRLQPAAGGAERKLEAATLEIDFAGDGGRPVSAVAGGGVRISEREPGEEPGRTLSSNRVRFSFFPASGNLRGMEAEGGVRTRYETAAGVGRGPIESASEWMSVRFLESNGGSLVESATQGGGFRYRDGAYSATAERCDYEASGERLTLVGGVRVVEASSVTTGARATYGWRERVLRFTGGVRTVLSGRTGELFRGAGGSPVVVSAPELAFRTGGRGGVPGSVRYRGGVRVLGESQQLEAQTLEILAGGERLEAEGGGVHRIFPGQGGKGSPRQGAAIRSAHLAYGEEKLAYSGGIELESDGVRLEADAVDVWIDPERKGIGRAEGRSGVRIAYQGRLGRGDTAEWLPEEGRFVIVGRPAVIDDPERGRSQARRLTYFHADDRILLGE